MADYRLYRLDGADKIASAEWLTADDDNHAASLAQALGATTTLEVWDRHRFVARIPPPSKTD